MICVRSAANRATMFLMAPKLTDEMRQALSEHPEQPVYVVDAATKQAYVLVPSGKYQKVKALLFEDGQPNPDEFLPLAHDALKEDWDAPGMEAYQEYDRHHQAA